MCNLVPWNYFRNKMCGEDYLSIHLLLCDLLFWWYCILMHHLYLPTPFLCCLFRCVALSRSSCMCHLIFQIRWPTHCQSSIVSRTPIANWFLVTTCLNISVFKSFCLVGWGCLHLLLFKCKQNLMSIYPLCISNERQQLLLDVLFTFSLSACNLIAQKCSLWNSPPQLKQQWGLWARSIVFDAGSDYHQHSWMLVVSRGWMQLQMAALGPQ